MDGPRSGGNAGSAGQYELFVSAAAVFDPVPDGLGRKAVRERHFYGGGRRTENPAGHAQLSVDKYAGNQRSDCRFYPGVAEKIAQDLGGDFYIAFTSIHEAQIHGVGMISPEIVEYSLQETNRECTRPEEVLSNHVYLYNQEKKTFSMLMDGDFLEVEHEE